MVKNLKSYKSEKISNNFRALENWNCQRQNYLEFRQISHFPRTDHNRYFHILITPVSYKLQPVSLGQKVGNSIRYTRVVWVKINN